jgi:hypothetical protein
LLSIFSAVFSLYVLYGRYSSFDLSKYNIVHISLSIPYFIIISDIILVALSKSFEAQVVMFSFPKNISSATLQPNRDIVSSRIFFFEYKYLSSSGIFRVAPKASPLRTIVIFSTLSASSNR